MQTARHRTEITEKDNRIAQILAELQQKLEEYQGLLQVKTALDMEIAVYRQLLETEEDRLGIDINNGEQNPNWLLSTRLLCALVNKVTPVFFADSCSDMSGGESSPELGGGRYSTRRVTQTETSSTVHSRNIAQTMI